MFADVTLVEVLLPVIALLGLYNLIANYIDRETRRESIGGVHDRLDALMGRRCAWCNKHLNDGANRTARQARVRLPETGRRRRGTGRSVGGRRESEGAREAPPQTAASASAQARRGATEVTPNEA